MLHNLTPAAESHDLWPWMNVPTFGRDAARLGVSQVSRAFPVGLHCPVKN